MFGGIRIRQSDQPEVYFETRAVIALETKTPAKVFTDKDAKLATHQTPIDTQSPELRD